MIFDRFKQVDKSLSRNTEGTGIGLNSVKSIVELHGGSIYVESEFGKGSKFTVMIPLNNRFQTEDYIIYALWGFGNSSVIKTNLKNATKIPRS